MKGHARKRGTKWCFVVDIGIDPITGKRKQKWFSGFKTKKEAEKAMVQKMSQLNTGVYVDLPKPDTLEKLAKALDTPYEEMMDKAGYLNNNIREKLSNDSPMLQDIDPDLLTKFAEIVKNDAFQSLFFHDILSASREEREQIVREWIELKKNKNINKEP